MAGAGVHLQAQRGPEFGFAEIQFTLRGLQAHARPQQGGRLDLRLVQRIFQVGRRGHLHFRQGGGRQVIMVQPGETGQPGARHPVMGTGFYALRLGLVQAAQHFKQLGAVQGAQLNAAARGILQVSQQLLEIAAAIKDAFPEQLLGKGAGHLRQDFLARLLKGVFRFCDLGFGPALAACQAAEGVQVLVEIQPAPV